MTKFALRGNQARTLPSAHSCEKLEIGGTWSTQGPQIVGGDGGAPEWVYELFQGNPLITEVALNYETCGVVWSRPVALKEARDACQSEV